MQNLPQLRCAGVYDEHLNIVNILVIKIYDIRKKLRLYKNSSINCISSLSIHNYIMLYEIIFCLVVLLYTNISNYKLKWSISLFYVNGYLNFPLSSIYFLNNFNIFFSGFRRFMKNIKEEMEVYVPHFMYGFWALTWLFLSPVVLTVCIVFSLLNHSW